jgi:hypothetical protein
LPKASLGDLKAMLESYYRTDDLTGGTRSSQPNPQAKDRLAKIERQILSYQYPEADVPQAVLESLQRGHVATLPAGFVSLTPLNQWATFIQKKIATYQKVKTADYGYFCWLVGAVVGELAQNAQVNQKSQPAGYQALLDALHSAYGQAQVTSFEHPTHSAGDFLRFGLQLGDDRACQQARKLIDDYAYGRGAQGDAESRGISNLLSMLSDAVTFNQVAGKTRNDLLNYFSKLTDEVERHKANLPYGALNTISF